MVIRPTCAIQPIHCTTDEYSVHISMKRQSVWEAAMASIFSVPNASVADARLITCG